MDYTEVAVIDYRPRPPGVVCIARRTRISVGVDVFRGSAVGAGVVGFLVTADPGKRDVEVKVLIDCTADEIDRVRRLLDDILRIGGLLVRRNLETATGSDSPGGHAIYPS